MAKLPLLSILKTELQGQGGLVQKIRKDWMPSGEELAKRAWKRVFNNKRLSQSDVKNNFNDYLCTLIDTEYQVYLEYEERCINEGILEFVLQNSVKKDFPKVYSVVSATLKTLKKKKLSDLQKLSEIIVLLRPFYKLVEQSFAQGRMSRAGGSSQYHLKELLNIAGYNDEFQMQQVLNGTVDFLFPNKRVWDTDRRKCVIVSIKRTLRERYKQVFEELDITGGITIYLFVTETLEESKNDISEDKVDKLNTQNIYLVVRDVIKTQRFPNKANVISFSDFIGEELPNKRSVWSQVMKNLSQQKA